MNDQIDIKFIKQEEYNANVVKRLEELEDFKDQALIRLDQEIENRTRAFEKIEKLEEKVEMMERYTIKGIETEIRDAIYNTSTKSERYDEIIAVHRNEIDMLKNKLHEETQMRERMQTVMDNYLMINLEKPEYINKVHEKRGTHGTIDLKGEKPKWMWILWRRHRRRHKILSSTQTLLRRVEMGI